jgi:hypothetical protein
MALHNLDFLKKGETFPPKAEEKRLKMYEKNRRLYDSEHDKVFRETWERHMFFEDGTRLDLVLDWPMRLSNLWADLLAGDPPTFTVGKEGSPEQTQLDDIIERNKFPTLLKEIGIEMSRFGGGVMKLRKEDGKAYIDGVQPDYWFPVTALSSPRAIKAHVLVWQFEAMPRREVRFWQTKPNEKSKMLKIEIHRKGEIEHRVVALGKDKRIGDAEHVGDHFAEDIGDGSGNLQENKDWGVIEKTPIEDDFLVHHIPSRRTVGQLHGKDDYKTVEGLVQEMESRLAQISRILNKHADPSMYGPASAVVFDRKTGETKFVGEGKYYPVYEDEEPPGYIIWDAQLTSAFEQLDKLLEAFYNLTETSPAAFGQIDAGLATSGTALRRLMQAPLAKVRGMRNDLAPVVQDVLKIAARLETGGVDVGHQPEEDEEGQDERAA